MTDVKYLAHRNSFDLKRKKYIFQGIYDRSMRNVSWRNKDSPVDIKKEEDKSYKIVENIRKVNNLEKDQYKRLRDKTITSYGIILYTWIRTESKNELKFLLSQRRDTIHYIEFPKYVNDDKMIPKIISLMTKDEKKRIMSCYNSDKIADLWFDLWINKRSK